MLPSFRVHLLFVQYSIAMGMGRKHRAGVNEKKLLQRGHEAILHQNQREVK